MDAVAFSSCAVFALDVCDKCFTSIVDTGSCDDTEAEAVEMSFTR